MLKTHIGQIKLPALIFLVFILSSIKTTATNYYISNTGNDFYDGKSPETAWKTIDQYNKSRSAVVAGDSILFKRGDKFIGRIMHRKGTPGKSIVYAAYGTGPKPVITGAESLSGWTSKGNDVYTMTSTQLYTHMFVNKKQITIARFPNELFTPIDSLDGRTIKNSSINIAGVNWKGATIHYRRQPDWYVLGNVLAHSGNYITVDTNVTKLTVGYGFYLDNHLAALDIAFEWFQDKNTKLVTIKLPSGVSPSSLLIEGSYVTIGLDLKERGEYIVVTGLEFRNFTEYGIHGTSVKEIQVLSCDFHFNNYSDVRLDGTSILYSADNIIDNNNFFDCNSTSVFFHNVTNSRVTNNKVKRTSMIPGYEWQGINDGCGMFLNMRNSYAGYNIIDSTGYSSMNSSGDNNLIERNIFSNHGYSKSDNGFIQSWGGNTHHNTIKENICFNGFGNRDGLPYDNAAAGYFHANGIYFDDFTHDNTIIGNTVYNSNNGIFIQSSQNFTVRDNLTYNCKGNGLSIHEKDPFEDFDEQSKSWIRDVKNISIKNNIFFSVEGIQNGYRVASSECGSPYDFGTSDSNYVINPYTHVAFSSRFRECNKYPSDPVYTLKTWQDFSGQDLNTKNYKNIRSEYTYTTTGIELITNGNFDQNVLNWSTYQAGVNSTWVAQGGFSGGGLMLDNTTTGIGELSGPKFSLLSGKRYLLKFSAKVKSNEQVVIAFARNSPYAQFFSKTFPISTDVYHGEWMFTSNVTESISKIQFYTKAGNTLWLDNVSLQEVTSAIQDDFNARSKLFVNDTKAEKTFDLQGLSYYDIIGNPVCGSIKLAPFRSTALIRNFDDTFCSSIKDCNASGYITREQWNFTGTKVSEIPVTTKPISETRLEIFESPQNTGDNYGARIRGFICPPSTGEYTFWIASDDDGELWLSTNEDPLVKERIAYVAGWTNPRDWVKSSTQKSVPINLIQGEKYYIEALHRDGTSGDNLAVGWDLPDGTQERPILGSRLTPFDTSSAATGIDERIMEKTIKIYPNPTDGLAQLQVSTEGSVFESVKLHDLTGVVIKTFETPRTSSTIDFPIDMSEFHAGTYLLEIQSRESKIVRKIVKY